MSRIETIAEGVTLYLGDCLEVLPILNLREIALVTDPPYGIRYKPGGGGRFSGEGGHVAKREWGTNAVPGDDAQFDPRFLLKAHLSNRILWGANNYASALPDRQGWLFWDKYCAPSSLTFAEGELAWTDLPITAKAFRHLWNGVCKASEVGETRLHPTQKPVELMTWCIGLMPPQTETVLDPYMGSGTTGVAAVKLGRKFIGIEVEQKYFDVACKRIEGASKQMDLFIERPKPIKQEAFEL